MAREGSFAGLDFGRELLRADTNKPSQGQVARKITLTSLVVVLAVGCWRLSEYLRGGVNWGESWQVYYGIPLAILVLGLWVCFRVNNYPKFADFLISVEGEMHKVSWPTWPVLVRSSGVVVLLIFFLAFSLFAFDIFWRSFFEFIGVVI